MPIFEMLKDVGSVMGLLSGVFLVWDRFAKGRPICSLSIVREGSHAYACLRIENVGTHDIAVLDVQVKPDVYILSKDLGSDSLVDASFGKRPSVMMAPKDKQVFIIAPRYADNQVRDEGVPRVRFSVYWRRCNATWLPQIPVWVVTSPAIIRMPFAIGKS